MELFEVTVSLLGYFDERLKTFVNPRIQPREGWPIYLVPDEMLARVLNPRALGSAGSAHVGHLLSRPGGRVPIVLSARELVSTHLAIIASTGAGKSYLAGVVIEELMKPAQPGLPADRGPPRRVPHPGRDAGHAGVRRAGRLPPVVKVITAGAGVREGRQPHRWATCAT